MSKKKAEFQTIRESRPYVLWRRVSTEGQGESGLGLAAQESIAKMFMGKDPVEIFTDVYSGTKLRQCKGLWDAIALCKKEGYVLVIAKSDRCRNVQEALDIVDAIGERNLIFCDIPSTDRFILTVMWAMWERQAIMGQVNTKLALAERKKQIAENGGFMSKSGNFCDHLGRKKGDKNPNAIRAMNDKKIVDAADWKRRSPLYLMATNMVLKGESRAKILQMAEELYEDDPVAYGTREGRKLTKGTLSKWAADVTIRN
jgi:DNA invertase Pin-like site-specific DNA recombinase